MWKFIDPITRTWEKNKVPLEKYQVDTDSMVKQLKVRYGSSATEEVRVEFLKQNEIGRNWSWARWGRTSYAIFLGRNGE